MPSFFLIAVTSCEIRQAAFYCYKSIYIYGSIQYISRFPNFVKDHGRSYTSMMADHHVIQIHPISSQCHPLCRSPTFSPRRSPHNITTSFFSLHIVMGLRYTLDTTRERLSIPNRVREHISYLCQRPEMEILWQKKDLHSVCKAPFACNVAPSRISCMTERSREASMMMMMISCNVLCLSLECPDFREYLFRSLSS